MTLGYLLPPAFSRILQTRAETDPPPGIVLPKALARGPEEEVNLDDNEDDTQHVLRLSYSSIPRGLKSLDF